VHVSSSVTENQNHDGGQLQSFFLLIDLNAIMSSLLRTPPPTQDARPTAARAKKGFDKRGAQIRTVHSPSDTLEARCRTVIAANLERYPPEAFGILSEDSWDAIVRERNVKTRPSTGTGGLDGTGRLLPAVSDRFLAQVEETNPHFSDSEVADRLAWKDCVEYRFRSGGLTRPAALQYPWPVLVNRLKRSGEALMELLNAADKPSDRKQELLEKHVQALSESPMTVSLLQASGVGKSVKKFIKACAKEKPDFLKASCKAECGTKGSHSANANAAVEDSPLSQLEETLQKWKHMAANSGVQITDDRQDNEEESNCDDQEDMRMAESCQSWRELFVALQQREEKRRADQGERMRKIRKNLATGRPRVIKVRPTKSRHDNILDRAEKKGATSFASSSTPAFTSGNAKMKALKKESRIATTLQKSSARPEPKKKHSFGAAVAFATNSKPTGPTKRHAVQGVTLAGGKRMKLPTAKGAVKRPPFRR